MALLAVGFAAACGGSGDADTECATTGQCTVTSVSSVSSVSNVSNVTNNTPTEDPTGAATGTGTGGPPTCEACGAEQVCVTGQCVDVPDQCPCPLETYCDLGLGKCVIGCTRDEECDEGRICDPIKRECAPGCREDADCGGGQICEGLVCIAGCRTDATCGPMEICDAMSCRQGCNTDGECPAGQICDATVCRAGCTADADCKTAGDICDPVKKVCRAGCYVDAECPLEKVCDAQQSCVPGCDSDAKCSAGKICTNGQCVAGCNDDSGCSMGQICTNKLCVAGCKDNSGCSKGQICENMLCVAGCAVQEDCPLRQYCHEKKCIEGCGPPGGHKNEAVVDRCAVGEACYPQFCDVGYDCSKFECTPYCFGFPCKSSANQTFDCISDFTPGYCMTQCDVNSDCSGGKVCALHAIPPEANHEDVGYCRSPCNSDLNCKEMFWKGAYQASCTCSLAGALKGKCVKTENNVASECQHKDGGK
jgi:hypothetical protein